MVIMAVVHAQRTTLLSQHAAHILAVGIPVLMVIVGLVWDDVRKHPIAPSAALRLAAVASLGAAAVHARVFPDHLRESALYGAFFVGAAMAQTIAAWLLVTRRSRHMVMLVALGNALVIALWLMTRLVTIPLGPAAGTVEAFSPLDVTASLLEAVVVAGCLWSLRPRPFPHRARLAAMELVTLPLVLAGTIAVCAVAKVA